MLRPLDSLFLSIAAVLVAAGMVVVAVPVSRPAAQPVALTVDEPCPFADLVIVG
ncbi:hypothetical protein [Paractinoplanes lichenicola]|uniref:Uncharacterized protein n=1 Tax=Paractinoplanes lichenicola TaxID=2802976 RepID=A0ABS1VMF3_9ACTN|nr:hypothetical protein [Actinoplanes lichenicola]MBL7255909.1 hypothetical protein [Actinoplanes lichenicola]